MHDFEKFPGPCTAAHLCCTTVSETSTTKNANSEKEVKECLINSMEKAITLDTGLKPNTSCHT